MAEKTIPIAALVIAVAMVVFWTWYWVRVLVEISRSDMDPRDKRRWWWRVFLLRLPGILWYHEHLKKQMRDRLGGRQKPPSGQAIERTGKVPIDQVAGR